MSQEGIMLDRSTSLFLPNYWKEGQVLGTGAGGWVDVVGPAFNLTASVFPVM